MRLWVVLRVDRAVVGKSRERLVLCLDDAVGVAKRGVLH